MVANRRAAAVAFLWVGVHLSLGSLAAEPTQEKVVRFDSIRLTGMVPSGPRFEVYVKCEFSPPGAESAKQYLGTDGQPPQCVVKALSIKLNGRPIRLPPSSYGDLADVHMPVGVYVTHRDKTLILHVEGGDGAGAYKARYVIKDDQLSVRQIEQLNEDGELKTTNQPFNN